MSFRFHNFKVYEDVRPFIKGIFILVAKLPKQYQYDLASQMKRAAISILLNLAEGSGKNSDKDFNRFIMISIGSIYEVVACLDIALDNNLISNKIYDKFYNKAEDIRNQLGALSKKLKTDG